MKHGRRFNLHGAYGSHAKAAREKPKGSFIVKRTIKHHTRWVVLSKKPKRRR